MTVSTPSRGPTAGQIARFVPASLDDICGNYRIKKALVARLNCEGDHPPLLIYGPTYTGKSAAMRWFGRMVCCTAPNLVEMRHCGRCVNCEHLAALYEQHLDDHPLYRNGVKWVPYDCGSAKPLQHSFFYWDKEGPDDVRIYWLDEAHRIGQELMGKILNNLQEDPHSIYVLTTINPKKIPINLYARLGEQIETEPPTVDELADWLRQKCREWRIEVEDDGVLPLLAQASRQNVAGCLHVMARAAEQPGRRITIRLIQDQQEYIDHLMTGGVGPR